MGIDDIGDEGKRFLTELFQMTQGDPSRQVSMYEVGAAIGLDRDGAGKTAEILMGEMLVAIKTLSGGIGITEAAADELRETLETADGTHSVAALPDTPVLDAAAQQAVDAAITAIKQYINDLGLDFKNVAAFVADIRTMEAQLTSPTPKTAIIRECFISLQSTVASTDHTPIKNQVTAILG